MIKDNEIIFPFETPIKQALILGLLVLYVPKGSPHMGGLPKDEKEKRV
jgi:hypothetical protein